MLFKCVLQTLGGKTPIRWWTTVKSVMDGTEDSQIMRRKGKRGAYTNQHEASLANVCVGKTPVFTQPSEWPCSPPYGILTLFTVVVAGVGARAYGGGGGAGGRGGCKGG